MAAYTFLWDTAGNQTVIERCGIAVAVLAQAVVDDAGSTAAEKAWAAWAFANPRQAGRQAAFVVVAANKDATENQINTASDATIQTNVNAAKAVLVAGTPA